MAESQEALDGLRCILREAAERRRRFDELQRRLAAEEAEKAKLALEERRRARRKADERMRKSYRPPKPRPGGSSSHGGGEPAERRRRRGQVPKAPAVRDPTAAPQQQQQQRRRQWGEADSKHEEEQQLRAARRHGLREFISLQRELLQGQDEAKQPHLPAASQAADRPADSATLPAVPSSSQPPQQQPLCWRTVKQEARQGFVALMKQAGLPVDVGFSRPSSFSSPHHPARQCQPASPQYRWQQPWQQEQEQQEEEADAGGEEGGQRLQQHAIVSHYTDSMLRELGLLDGGEGSQTAPAAPAQVEAQLLAAQFAARASSQGMGATHVWHAALEEGWEQEGTEDGASWQADSLPLRQDCSPVSPQTAPTELWGGSAGLPDEQAKPRLRRLCSDLLASGEVGTQVEAAGRGKQTTTWGLAAAGEQLRGKEPHSGQAGWQAESAKPVSPPPGEQHQHQHQQEPLQRQGGVLSAAQDPSRQEDSAADLGSASSTLSFGQGPPAEALAAAEPSWGTLVIPEPEQDDLPRYESDDHESSAAEGASRQAVAEAGGWDAAGGDTAPLEGMVGVRRGALHWEDAGLAGAGVGNVSAQQGADVGSARSSGGATAARLGQLEQQMQALQLLRADVARQLAGEAQPYTPAAEGRLPNAGGGGEPQCPLVGCGPPDLGQQLWEGLRSRPLQGAAYDMVAADWEGGGAQFPTEAGVGAQEGSSPEKAAAAVPERARSFLQQAQALLSRLKGTLRGQQAQQAAEQAHLDVTQESVPPMHMAQSGVGSYSGPAITSRAPVEDASEQQQQQSGGSAAAGHLPGVAGQLVGLGSSTEMIAEMESGRAGRTAAAGESSLGLQEPPSVVLQRLPAPRFPQQPAHAPQLERQGVHRFQGHTAVWHQQQAQAQLEGAWQPQGPAQMKAGSPWQGGVPQLEGQPAWAWADPHAAAAQYGRGAQQQLDQRQPPLQQAALQADTTWFGWPHPHPKAAHVPAVTLPVAAAAMVQAAPRPAPSYAGTLLPAHQPAWPPSDGGYAAPPASSGTRHREQQGGKQQRRPTKVKAEAPRKLEGSYVQAARVAKERVARDEEQLKQLQQESLALKAAAKQRLRQQGKKAPQQQAAGSTASPGFYAAKKAVALAPKPQPARVVMRPPSALLAPAISPTAQPAGAHPAAPSLGTHHEAWQASHSMHSGIYSAVGPAQSCAPAQPLEEACPHAPAAPPHPGARQAPADGLKLVSLKAAQQQWQQQRLPGLQQQQQQQWQQQQQQWQQQQQQKPRTKRQTVAQRLLHLATEAQLLSQHEQLVRCSLERINGELACRGVPSSDLDSPLTLASRANSLMQLRLNKSITRLDTKLAGLSQPQNSQPAPQPAPPSRRPSNPAAASPCKSRHIKPAGRDVTAPTPAASGPVSSVKPPLAQAAVQRVVAAAPLQPSVLQRPGPLPLPQSGNCVAEPAACHIDVRTVGRLAPAVAPASAGPWQQQQQQQQQMHMQQMQMQQMQPCLPLPGPVMAGPGGPQFARPWPAQLQQYQHQHHSLAMPWYANDWAGASPWQTRAPATLPGLVGHQAPAASAAVPSCRPAPEKTVLRPLLPPQRRLLPPLPKSSGVGPATAAAGTSWSMRGPLLAQQQQQQQQLWSAQPPASYPPYGLQSPFPHPYPQQPAPTNYY